MQSLVAKGCKVFIFVTATVTKFLSHKVTTMVTNLQPVVVTKLHTDNERLTAVVTKVARLQKFLALTEFSAVLTELNTPIIIGKLSFIFTE